MKKALIEAKKAEMEDEVPVGAIIIHNDKIIRGENTPTQDELGAGRFFSPIFGAMGVVVAFQIGLLLFNPAFPHVPAFCGHEED